MSALIDLNPADSAVVANPYPLYEQLRAAGPLIWSENLDMWLAPSYQAASAVLRNPQLGRIYQPRLPAIDWEIFNWLHSDSILDSEPPKHTRLRSLVTKTFTRGRIEAMRPAIENICAELLEHTAQQVQERGQFDLLADYAEPLPVLVIAKLLGVPAQMSAELRSWSQAIVKMYEVGPTAAEEADALSACAQFSEYISTLARERKRKPADDLITALVQAQESGEKLNEHELIAMCVLLLNAGHEASVNGFGNGFVSLFQHPDQLRELAQDPDGLASSALEEMLRFDSPLHIFDRTATADTEIAGVTISTGQKVAALLGSANRDEQQFVKAATFNIHRTPNSHIAFGAGIHFCVGAPLARLEMNISLPLLLKKYPDLKLAGQPAQRPTFVLRGWETIPVC
jgi:cytochrome P450